MFFNLSLCRLCTPNKNIRERVGIRGKKIRVKDDSKNLRLIIEGRTVHSQQRKGTAESAFHSNYFQP